MFDIQRFTTLPYGLMSAADKASLDAIPNTYATKAELSNYVRCVQTDSGYNLVNGDGEIVFSVSLENPHLTVNPSAITLYDGKSTTVTVTQSGNGAITVETATAESGTFTAVVSGSEITISNADITSGSGTVTVKVAGTSEYKSASVTIPITFKTKFDPQLTVNPSSISVDGMVPGFRESVTITRLGNGTVTAIGTSEQCYMQDGNSDSYPNYLTKVLTGNTLIIRGNDILPGGQYSFTITVAETDEYKSASCIIVITVTDDGGMA